LIISKKNDNPKVYLWVIEDDVEVEHPFTLEIKKLSYVARATLSEKAVNFTATGGRKLDTTSTNVEHLDIIISKTINLKDEDGNAIPWSKDLLDILPEVYANKIMRDSAHILHNFDDAVASGILKPKNEED